MSARATRREEPVLYEVLQWGEVAVFGALTVASALRARRRNARATMWVAAMFGLFTVVVFLGILLAGRQSSLPNIWLLKGFIAALAIAPYLLFRFSARFFDPSKRAEAVAAASTAVIVVWTLAITRFVPRDAPRPVSLAVYGDLFLATWAGILGYCSVRMFRAGRGLPPVARIRMRLIGTSAGLFGILVLAQTIIKGDDHDARAIVMQFVTLTAGIVFFFGIAPPRLLRLAMHGRDWQSLQRTIRELIADHRPDAVVEAALSSVVASVGARAAAMVDENGAVAGVDGISPDAASAAAAAPDEEAHRRGMIVLPLSRGKLIVWEGRCAPLIGREELAVCGSIAGLAELALERCRVWESQERFIASAAHELRTPLTTLVGVASTLTNHRRRLSADDEQQLTESFDRQALRVKTLVDNLLDLAKLEQGRVIPALEAVPLARAVAAALEAAPAPDGYTVRIAVAPSITVIAERARLEQVVVNLLTNAYRYGGRDISITGSDAGGRALLAVSDDGEGVPEEIVPSLFAAFTRGPNASGRGSGLGLAITRGLVEAMAGSISYHRGSGGGARFEVDLRVADTRHLAEAG